MLLQRAADGFFRRVCVSSHDEPLCLAYSRERPPGLAGRGLIFPPEAVTATVRARVFSLPPQTPHPFPGAFFQVSTGACGKHPYIGDVSPCRLLQPVDGACGKHVFVADILSVLGINRKSCVNTPWRARRRPAAARGRGACAGKGWSGPGQAGHRWAGGTGKEGYPAACGRRWLPLGVRQGEISLSRGYGHARPRPDGSHAPRPAGHRTSGPVVRQRPWRRQGGTGRCMRKRRVACSSCDGRREKAPCPVGTATLTSAGELVAWRSGCGRGGRSGRRPRPLCALREGGGEAQARRAQVQRSRPARSCSVRGEGKPASASRPRTAAPWR